MSRQLMVSCIIFAFIVSLSTFFTPHTENDERVYKTLAKRIACKNSTCFLFDFKQYNLLGSPILNNLVDPEYRNTVFFHPPTFIMALSLAYQMGGDWGMKVLPLLLYALIVYTIYKTLTFLEVSQKTAEYGILLSICSPLLLFNTQKLWMDLFMGCMLIISFYFLLYFIKQKKIAAVLVSGLFFFLAVFTKYWAFITLVPFVLLLILYARKKVFFLLLLFSLPLFFFIVNYFFKIIPISAHPILNNLANMNGSLETSLYPFITYVKNRPFFYYFYSMFLINPAYVYIGLTSKEAWRGISSEHTFINSIQQFLLYFITYSLFLFSIVALFGAGFQTRYVLFIEPFIILLVCLMIERSKHKELTLLFIFLVHNILLVMMNAVFFNSAELFPFIEMLWVF